MEKQQKMLEKVRALLAKADSTNFPEEADAFRAKADELMTAYALEMWMVDEGQESGRPEPESRDINVDWYWSSDRGSDLWSLFHACAFQARCKVVWWRGYETVPVIGLPADLDYFDLLFTQLQLELVKRIEPKPDPEKSVEENIYKLRSSGTRWMRATQLMYDAGLINAAPDYGNAAWSQLPKSVQMRLKNRLAQVARDYRRREGLEDYTHVHPEVYARSFAQGFVAEIRVRFRDMRRLEEKPSSGENNMALALRDIRQVVGDAATAMYGEPPKSKAVATREVAFNAGAYQKGAQEGRKVNLSGSPQHGLKNRKELPR